MKKTIWKYPLSLGSNTLSMPLHSQILSAQLQSGTINIWVLADESEKIKEDRTISIFGTGHPLPAKADVSNWIATIQDGQYVWHLFEFTK